jgi:fructose-bisphosphate aldolase, class II
LNMDLPTKIASTRVAVELARHYGASVEAELDHIGRTEVEDGGALTEPDDAASFARETGIDIIAVSVGTTHGLSAGEAVVDVDRIAAIRAVTPAFLSLHGGTGVRPEDLVAAIHAGITKISYFHGMARDAQDALRASLKSAPHGMLATTLDEALRTAFRDRCRQMLQLYGGPGRPAGG